MAHVASQSREPGANPDLGSETHCLLIKPHGDVGRQEVWYENGGIFPGKSLSLISEWFFFHLSGITIA